MHSAIHVSEEKTGLKRRSDFVPAFTRKDSA